jgi:hypothetical protein
VGDVVSQYELYSGENFVRDRPLTNTEYGLNAAGLVGGTILGAIADRLKWFRWADDAAGEVDEAAELAARGGKAEKTAIRAAETKVADGAAFSNPHFGNQTHSKFEKALTEQTGTTADDWIVRTQPGQTGVDATYIGSKARYPGFAYAELKPLTANGFKEFTRQLDKWQLTVGETALWFYNRAGIIGRAIGENW